MIHRTAAQHADLRARIEQHEVDGGLQRNRRLVVLGVQPLRAGQRHDAEIPLPLDAGRPKIDAPIGQIGGQERHRLRLGPQHRLDQVCPDERIRQPLGKELSLGQLDALLRAELAAALGRDLVGTRDHTRMPRGGPFEQLLHAQPEGAALGQLVVEGGVVPQWGGPRGWTLDHAHNSPPARLTAAAASPYQWIPKR